MSDAVRIRVPKAGIIVLTQLPEWDLVSFWRGRKGVADFTVSTQEPVQERSVYQSVKKAVDLYETRDPDGSLDWEVYTKVPIGEIKVARHRYRVVDDGHGGSDTTVGTHDHKVVKVLRGLSESLGECVMRTIQETDPGEDFGTLDSFSGGPSWRTCPFPDLSGDPDVDQRYGQPYIAHWVSFVSGEILYQLPQLAEEFREAGASW